MHGFQLFVVTIYWPTCVLTFGGCAVSFVILFVFCLPICLCLWEVSRKCVLVWAVGARWVMCLWGAASWKSARGGATRFLPLLAPLLALCGGMAAGYGGSRALVFLHHSSWWLVQRTSSIKEMFVAMLCWLDSLRIEETSAESEQCHMPWRICTLQKSNSELVKL